MNREEAKGTNSKERCKLHEYCDCCDCKYKEELLRGYIALYKKKIRENLRERKKNM
jgi:hypothetical protein